jgi:hypothetical protein
MITCKSLLLFASGCLAGVFATFSLVNAPVKVFAAGYAQGPYADVPASHPAASSVSDLKKKGIVTGFADNTYRGSAPVTRYEMAVVLERFAKYYDRSKRPLASSTVPLPVSPAWVSPAREYLASNAFVSPQSPFFKNPGTNLVSADEFAATLSSIMDRIVDRSLPPSTN